MSVDRRRLTLLLVPIGVFVVVGYAGTVLSPTLLVHHPVWLLALDSRLRHLLLTAGGGIDPAPFFAVGFVRLLLPDPLYFLLGWWYGDAGLRWIEKKAGGEIAYYRWVEKAFVRAGSVLVFVMPNNLVCLLAGAARMPAKRFAVLNASGTLARLVLVWTLGRAFQDPLSSLIDDVQRYQWPLMGVLFAIGVLQAGRRAAKGQIESIGHIEDEIEEEIDGELAAGIEAERAED